MGPRRRLIPTGLIAIAGTLYGAAPLPACPLCDGDTGRAVRAGITDDNHLPLNVAAIALPFAVVAGIVLVVHFGPPARRHRNVSNNTRGPS